MIGPLLLRGAAVAAAVLLPVGLVAVAAPAQAAPKPPTPKTATVSVLHAIPGAVVDVYAGSTMLIDNFTQGTLKTLKVPGGTYDLGVYADGQGPGSGTPILAASATVKAGDNVTVTANLDGAGKPALNVFGNSTSKLPKHKGRLTVRHIAAAPAVDVWANGAVVFPNLTNPNQASAVVPKGLYQAAATAAGSTVVALGPAPVRIRQGWNTIVYAWGAPGGYQLAVQYVKTR